MGCGASKGPVPTLGQLQKDGALMEWIDARTAEGTFPTDWQGKKIVKAELIGNNVEGGFMGYTRRCTLTFDDGSIKDAFLKLSKDDRQSLQQAKELELTREVSFFNLFKTNGIQFEHMKLPEVYIACSDAVTYRNIVIMGYIEGSQNLWQLFGEFKYKSRPDLDRPINVGGSNVVAIDMAKQVARIYGEFHGNFWMDKTFLAENKSWIHAANYFSGENLKGYEKMISDFKTCWKLIKAGLHPGTVIHKWDKLTASVIDACLKKSTAEEFRKHYIDGTFQWTLCHKDSHPGNWVYDPKDGKIVTIDWELVGLGSGPMDLAVFILIRSNPEWRRKYEKEIVETYYEALIAAGEKKGILTKESYPIEQLWKDFALQGANRMIMYATSLPMAFGAHLTQDLERSLLTFIQDHNITPENIPPFLW